MKAASTGSALKGLVMYNSDTMLKNNMAYMQNGKIFMSKASSGYEICDFDSGKYSEISLLYTNNETRGTIFADGKMIGVVGIADGTAVGNATHDEIAFTFSLQTRVISSSLTPMHSCPQITRVITIIP